jgi:hypothetical protein
LYAAVHSQGDKASLQAL